MSCPRQRFGHPKHHHPRGGHHGHRHHHNPGPTTSAPVPSSPVTSESTVPVSTAGSEFHICVAGRSGVGKSTLINALRGIENPPFDEKSSSPAHPPDPYGPALSGIVETTMRRACYKFPPKGFPNHAHINLWDIPGGNTRSHPAETYWRDNSLFAYDLLLIVHDDRYEELDLKLLNLASIWKVNSAVVRTKLDSSFSSARVTTQEKNSAVQQVVSNVQTQLQQSSLQIARDRIFLVSRSGLLSLSVASEKKVDKSDVCVDDEQLNCFLLQSASIRDGRTSPYCIRHECGSVLSVREGTQLNTQIIEEKQSGSIFQYWRFIPVSSLTRVFQIQNVGSGLFLDVEGTNNSNGTKIVQSKENERNSQKFFVDRLDSQPTLIVAQHSKKAVDRNSGICVHQWDADLKNNNQRFYVQSEFSLIDSNQSQFLDNLLEKCQTRDVGIKTMFGNTYLRAWYTPQQVTVNLQRGIGPGEMWKLRRKGGRSIRIQHAKHNLFLKACKNENPSKGSLTLVKEADTEGTTFVVEARGDYSVSFKTEWGTYILNSGHNESFAGQGFGSVAHEGFTESKSSYSIEFV